MNWQSIKQTIAAILIAVGLLITPIWTKVAQADDLGLVTAAEAYVKTVQEARSVFSDLATEAQTFLQQGNSDLQKAFQELPQDLERLAAAPDVATRTQIQSEMTAKQQSLKTFATSFSDWITKAETADKQYEKTVETANEEFEKAVEAAEDGLKSASHDKVASLKKSFKQTSKLISGLADSTSKAASGKGVFVQAQYDEQLAALGQAFDQMLEAVKSFN